jgi:hypothetical protein
MKSAYNGIMSEGPKSTRRRLKQLFSLLGILLSLGICFGAMEAQRGELIWVIFLPFASGLVFGGMMPKGRRFEALALAPVVSIFFVGTILIATCTYQAVVDPNPDISAPYIVQGIAGVVFGIPMLVVGTIPAVIGATISSSQKIPSIPEKPISD